MGCGVSRGSRARWSRKVIWDFKRIDNHVQNTPQSALQSLQSLAEYLNSGATSDLERIRAVYKWITANLIFKINDDNQCEIMFPPSARGLESKTDPATDSATLARSLLNLIGIENNKISGICKGAGYDPTKPIEEKPNHSWTAVKLNGDWRFMDCTFGAGFVTENKEFKKRETDFYFLTDPEIFILDHFPLMRSNINEIKNWQLLSNPIDLRTFHRHVMLPQHCFEQDVELVSHKDALIDVDGEVTIKFRGLGDRLAYFSSSFINPDTRNKMSSGCYTATILDWGSNEATVIARPPTSGTYWELRIFGTTDAKSENVGCLVSYQLLAKVPSRLAQFPNFTGFYGLLRSPELCGFSSDMCRNQKFHIKYKSGEAELRLRLQQGPPDASARLQFADDSEAQKGFTLIETENQAMKISLRMHRQGFHRLTLRCNDIGSEEDDSMPALANFLIECAHPMEKPRPFPEFLTRAVTEQVSLESPRDRDLPANSAVKFRLQSPTLKSVMIQGKDDDKVFRRVGGNVFDFTVKAGKSGSELFVFGALEEEAKKFFGLYKFLIV